MFFKDICTEFSAYPDFQLDKLVKSAYTGHIPTPTNQKVRRIVIICQLDEF